MQHRLIYLFVILYQLRSQDEIYSVHTFEDFPRHPKNKKSYSIAVEQPTFILINKFACKSVFLHLP